MVYDFGRTTHVAHTVYTITTRFMSLNHVVPSRTTKFLSVWTHLKSLPTAYPSVLLKSFAGTLKGSSMAPLLFARILLSLVSLGILFMDVQKLFQLLTLACLTTRLY